MPDAGQNPLKLLLVDDDEAIQELMARLLQKHGVMVAAASTGKEAIEIAAATKPQLILLDIVLPGEDGFHVLEELKSLPETQHIPVVMFSVLESAEHIEKASSLGALDAIPKPFQVKETVERIVSLLLGKGRDVS